MRLEDIARSLSASGAAIVALISEISLEEARWKPTTGGWSILEVLNHLYDEEREDFRRRLDLLVHHPEEPWPSVDPETWCRERRYNERDFQESLKRFETERERSLEWLPTLRRVDWDRRHDHPRLGPLRAGDIALAWMVHDHLHLRQLGGLSVAYRKLQSPAYSSAYAGEW